MKSHVCKLLMYAQLKSSYLLNLSSITSKCCARVEYIFLAISSAYSFKLTNTFGLPDLFIPTYLTIPSV